MNVVSDKSRILEFLDEISKPSMLRFDESYYENLDFIHCIIYIDKLNIYKLDELINIDESLIKHSNRVLININSGLELKVSEIEAITNIISNKTNFKDYHINLQFDL